jgi:hypothetical protein
LTRKIIHRYTEKLRKIGEPHYLSILPHCSPKSLGKIIETVIEVQQFFRSFQIISEEKLVIVILLRFINHYLVFAFKCWDFSFYTAGIFYEMLKL